ncbi:MAG: hydrogen peroxide-inducible genes activator [Rhodospirillales bacterium]|nr:MAG: hydrogen peroxide-inducible genes activator [Rhodospirillales bacterium]
MIDLPSPRQLRYLVAIADTGGFGRAAARCAVTQSTLSAGIKELEATLGATLIERRRGGPAFTPAGERVLERARRLLADSEELVELARDEAEPLAGALRVGVIPTVAPYLLPRLLPRLRRRFPKLRPFLVEERTATLVAQLDAAAIDVALIALPYDLPRLAAFDCFEDRFVFAAPRGHPLLARAAVGLAALRAETVLLLTEGHCLRDHALSVCRLDARETARAVEATSLSTLIQMVDSGLGVTLLPAMAVAAGALRGMRVETRPLEDREASRRIGLAWRATSPRAPHFRLLGEAVRDVAGVQQDTVARAAEKSHRRTAR